MKYTAAVSVEATIAVLVESTDVGAVTDVALGSLMASVTGVDTGTDTGRGSSPRYM